MSRARAVGLLRDRMDFAVLGAVLIGLQFTSHHIPIGVYAIGLVSGAAPSLPGYLPPRHTREDDVARRAQFGKPVGFPFGPHFKISGITSRPADVLTVVLAVVAMVGLYLFLRHSRTGVALRGAAENANR